MALFESKKSTTLLILIVIAITSSHCDENQPSACKPVLVENCAENFCIINITIIDKCPTNSTDGELKKKCENFTDVDLFTDIFLFRPVTDELENVTYWNYYCAKCNQKNLDSGRLKFWTLRAFHSIDSRHNSSFISEINIAVREKTHVDNNTNQRISNIQGLDRKILPLRYLPSTLKNSSFETCLSNATETVEFLKKSNTEAFLPLPEEFDCTGKKFCSMKPSTNTCIYMDTGNFPCIENEFFVEKVDFIYDGNKVIIGDGRAFDSDYINATDVRGILLCSLQNKISFVMRSIREFVKYAKYISTVLLSVFIIMKTNKKYFSSLPKLILYSYCMATLLVYLYQIFNPLISGRLFVRTYIMFYTYLCHALWSMIISYEYWYIISATSKFRKYDLKLKQYRIYGLIGWIIPIILLCAFYFSLTDEDKSAVCPRFDNLYYAGTTEYLSDLARLLHMILFFLYLVGYLILIPVVALQGCNFIRLAKNRRSIKEQCASRRRDTKRTQGASELDYLLIFTKIAYLMGIHGMIFCIMVIIAIIFDLDHASIISVLNEVGQFLLATQGTFIFFIFGFGTVRATFRSTRPFSFITLSTRSSRVVESEVVEIRPRPDE